MVNFHMKSLKKKKTLHIKINKIHKCQHYMCQLLPSPLILTVLHLLLLLNGPESFKTRLQSEKNKSKKQIVALHFSVCVHLQCHQKQILQTHNGDRRLWERSSHETEWRVEGGWLSGLWRHYVLYEAIKQKAAAFPFILSSQ